jgi:UDP-glucose 4-epimerase
LMATKDLTLEAFGQIYNVGTGINYSVNQIADMISDSQVHIPPRRGESRITLADNDRLSNLGWEPKHTIEDYIKTSTEN